MNKKILGIGLACLTTGTLLAGCGASNTQPTETTTAETTTTTTTTAAETTTASEAPTTITTEAPATATTEAWRSKYEGALIQPKKNPEEVWEGVYKVELRLDNGMHIFLPSFQEGFVDGQEAQGNVGFGISDPGSTNGLIQYYDYDKNTGKIHYGKDYFEFKSNEVHIGIHESIIYIAGRISNIMPEGDDIHKYKKVEEKEGKVYYIDFMVPYYKGSGYGEWEEKDFENTTLTYFNKYADMIADTAWVEKNNNSEMYGLTSHPEDDVFMDYLRQYYRTHDTSGGTPAHDYGGNFTRYAIADFDSDGENELAVQFEDLMGGEIPISNLFIYKVNYCDFSDLEMDYAYISNKKFNEITFLDNGVVYYSIRDDIKQYYPNIEYLDNKQYQILSDDMYEKLNYSLDNVRDNNGKVNHSFVLQYRKENNVITKALGAQEDVFTVEKTQEEYEKENQMLNSGKVMDIQVKDFTAENLGL